MRTPPEPVSAGKLARALRQRLEVIRAFGWELPVRPVRRPAPEPPRPVVVEENVTPTCQPLVPDEVGLPVVEDERAAREKLLEPVRAEVAGCTRCSLCKGRTRTVFGVGDPCARLMFIGEGPGYDEDRQGEPFVGRAGQLLNDIIRAMRLSREQVYIANIVKCRPPNNRNPDLQEMASCFPYLRRQIEIVAPEVICALGSVAARALLRTTSSVGALRGRFHDFEGIPLRVTYHPAYLLRSPGEKRKTWADVQTVMKLLQP